MRQVLISALASALLSATLLALTAVHALASHVQCGDVITQSTTLDGDLVNCPGDGIVIGAHGITLNLNGHTIDGDGAADTPSTPDTGVNDPGGFSEIEVLGGTITEFESGLHLSNAIFSLLRGITVATNGFGVQVDFAGANRIEHLRLIDNLRPGISVSFGSNANLVENNSVIATRSPGPFWGILIFGGSENSIRKNAVSGHRFAGLAISGNGNLIEKNSVSHNEFDGLSVFGSGNDVWDNAARENGDDGIDVEESPNSIGGNRADFNGDLGIEAASGVTDAGGNRARGNGYPAQCLNVACR
jgi:parallel beta-helix repeat protein